MSNNNQVTNREEDLIEAIYRSPDRDTGVTVTYLCGALKLAKPSVSLMLKRLQEKELIERQPYGRIYLTKEGEKLAQEVLRLHQAIKNALIAMGVSEEIAEADACKMEHFLHKETLEALTQSLCSREARGIHNRRPKR
ncbi:metal-dependent transcriptional regulator [Coprothermobacteraceae bacterium]|nr:metal-dependent transcriptional regulator [Coprothermobacteraceae bacterium]